MEKNVHEIRYTQLFQDDLMKAADYIAFTLENPMAADNLVDDTEKEAGNVSIPSGLHINPAIIRNRL